MFEQKQRGVEIVVFDHLHFLSSFLPKQPALNGWKPLWCGLQPRQRLRYVPRWLRDKKDSITSQVKHETTKPQKFLSEAKPSVKSCYNCASRRFGWKHDTSWDSCDEVCQIGDVGTLLFCIHGMTPQQVTAKLRTLSCEKWKNLVRKPNA